MSEETPSEERKRDVSREEFELLLRRVEHLESALARGRPPQPAAPVTYVSAPQPPPAAPRPPPVAAHPSAPVQSQAQARAPASAKPTTVGIETLLGQRFAPRIGAILVFLATLFFLGVAIQRGWIGPLAQLAIAAATALGLVAFAEALAARKGYGRYPMILEALGACVLYATAFASYALPYYQAETNLTDVGGGIMMALVAAATVALALRHDERIIASVGYTLSFITAGLGWDVLPALTIPYVAILGTSLALLVAWKGWTLEGALGSVLTGGFFVAFALDAVTPPPDPWLVALTAAPAFLAFFWLSTRPAPAGSAKATIPVTGILAFVTLVWAVMATAIPLADTARGGGFWLFGWTAAAVGLAFLVRARGGDISARVAYGGGAVALYLIAAPLAWDDVAESDLAITATYALAALALALLARAMHRAQRALWNGGLVLAGAAALRAVFLDERLSLSLSPAFENAIGSWQAFATFGLLVPAIALLFAFAPKGASVASRIAFLLGVLFLGAWAFALFKTALLTTLYLALVGGALAAAALARPGRSLSRDALGAGVLLVALAALKAGSLDAHATSPQMHVALAGLETVLVTGALLALYHAGAGRRLLDENVISAGALIGGAAAVVGSYVFAYADGAWVSILLGAMGVAFLAAGFALRAHAMYRYVGFAALGFVLVRVFAVDLRETDLAIRAIVFAVLGAILLGIGFVYARINRKAEPPM